MGRTDGLQAQALSEVEKRARRKGGSLIWIVTTLSLLIAVFLIVAFYPWLFVTIHAGERGVMWSRWTGTDLHSVYLEGTQFVWPWNELTVYDIRYRTIPQTLTLLTDDGLPIKVSMMVRVPAGRPYAGPAA